jgi:type I restriction enzyme, S subunit
MSEFPHGWSTRVIEEICDIHDYRRIPLSSEERRERKGPYPYYGANNIQDRIDDFIFDFDAVLIAEDGGYYDEHEYRDIAQYATGKYWVNNHAHILTGKPGLDTRFLYYSLVRKNICPWINTGTRSKLNQSDLKQIELLVPPLPEQKKIAEILSGIDRAIVVYEQQAKVLANMLDALMQEEVAMNTSAKWIKIGDACTAHAGGTPDRSQKGYYEGGIPWVKSGEVKGDDIFQTDESISEEAVSNSSAKIVPSGSVLVAMYGATAGQTARLRIDATTNQAVLSLNSNTSELSNDYLYHSVTAFKNQLLLTCQGSGQPNLSSGLIKELEIPLPDPLVQHRISSALDSVRHRVSALRSKINSAKSLKSSVSADLLSGRKRVSI